MDFPDKLKNYNLYHLLGIEAYSETDEIKKGYRGFAKKYHPDTSSAGANSAQIFDLGTEAYRFLMDEGKRCLYNRWLMKNAVAKDSQFKSAELVLQRRKSYKQFYNQRGLVDYDFNRFVDECRNNFVLFLKNGWQAKISPKFYSQKDMKKDEYTGFVEECRNDFQDFLKTVPRVRRRRR